MIIYKSKFYVKSDLAEEAEGDSNVNQKINRTQENKYQFSHQSSNTGGILNLAGMQ